MAINRYAYFATGNGADAAGEAVMLPVAQCTGLDIKDDNELEVKFKDLGAAFSTDISTITLMHFSGHSVEAMEQVCNAFTSIPKDGFIVMCDTDEVSGTKYFFSPSARNVLTDAAISL
jgi:hypothetical protein|tara:strand:+ start:266 stop:619 length:354 start_codon:yes stop_codon:yes gene_type:complete